MRTVICTSCVRETTFCASEKKAQTGAWCVSVSAGSSGNLQLAHFGPATDAMPDPEIITLIVVGGHVSLLWFGFTQN